MTHGFDLLAPVYDSLARFVFGKSIHDSQIWFLDQIPTNSTVLILGGGTGWLLEELQNRNPSSIVYYVEASSKMIKKSRQRKLNNSVYFIHGTEESIPSHLKFSVVITNFYLDLFSNETLNKIVYRIHSQTTAASIWLVAEFVNSAWWHRWMLKAMYFFFRVVCKIEGTQLPDWFNSLQNHGWKVGNSKQGYGNFIKSVVWRRA